MRCVFTRAAEQDLEGIADFIATDNPRRAFSFVADIKERCAKIAERPNAAALARAFGENIRKVPFGNYIIFYTVEDESVVVLRILHGRRDLPKLFES